MRVTYVIASVVLALGCLAGYVLMVLFAPGKESAYLGAVELIALPLLVGFGGYLTGQLQTIREQTNGTIGKLVATVQEHSRMLAAASVPSQAILAPQGPVQGPGTVPIEQPAGPVNAPATPTPPARPSGR